MSRLKCVGENDYDDDDDFYYDDDYDCNDDDDNDYDDDDYERHPTPLQEEHVLRKI